MEFELILASLATGALGGAIYGVTGYYRVNSRKEGKVDFKWKSFATTVLGAAGIGAASTYMGMPYDLVATGATGVLIVQFVKKIIGILESKLKQN